jgi:Methyl-accepting chemotaxis protein (MCP) signalling domain
MNEIRVASDRISDILRAIDEIAFHTSMLALNAAVEAAGEVPVSPVWSAQAASDTLALIEGSITEGEALRGVAERLRRMRCVPADISQNPALVAVRQTRPFSDAR